MGSLPLYKGKIILGWCSSRNIVGGIPNHSIIRCVKVDRFIIPPKIARNPVIPLIPRAIIDGLENGIIEEIVYKNLVIIRWTIDVDSILRIITNIIPTTIIMVIR